MDLNKVLLIGNLTADPEPVRFLQSGTAVGRLRLAVNRRYTGREGDKREETLYIDVDVWGKQAENCAQYLRKGGQVLVEGRLKMDQFQTKEGENRTKYVIVAETVRFGARPEGGGGGGGRSGGRHQESSGGRGGDSYDDSHAQGSSGGTEDDLPF